MKAERSATLDSRLHAYTLLRGHGLALTFPDALSSCLVYSDLNFFLFIASNRIEASMSKLEANQASPRMVKEPHTTVPTAVADAPSGSKVSTSCFLPLEVRNCIMCQDVTLRSPLNENDCVSCFVFYLFFRWIVCLRAFWKVVVANVDK